MKLNDFFIVLPSFATFRDELFSVPKVNFDPERRPLFQEIVAAAQPKESLHHLASLRIEVMRVEHSEPVLTHLFPIRW